MRQRVQVPLVRLAHPSRLSRLSRFFRPQRPLGHVALSAVGVFVVTAVLVAFPARATVPRVVSHVHSPMMTLTSNSPASQQFSGMAAVGALFPAGSTVASSLSSSTKGLDIDGGHFCTAAVVDSPAGNLAVTAAHCVSKSSPIAFVPGYHGGTAPYGTWLVTRVFTAPGWAASQDPDEDVAFLQLAPARGGITVENVTGAEHLVTGDSSRELVQVIGYPSDTDEPVWCVNWTREFSPTQLEFDCGGYPNGTSGGPFLADVDPASGQGTVIGVIGGYQQGGDTDAISYSAAFGSAVASLYQAATAT